MKIKQQKRSNRDNWIEFKILLAIVLIFLLCIYYIWVISMPFAFASILAYAISKIALKAENKGIPRWVTSIIYSVCLYIVIGAIFTLCIPYLYEQSAYLLYSLNDNVPYVKSVISKGVDENVSIFPEYLVKIIADSLGDVTQYISTFSVEVLNRLLKSSLAVAGFLAIILITPIITFYMVKDWKNFVSTIYFLVPKRYRPDFIYITSSVKDTVINCFMGQIMVCIIMGIIYVVALSILGMRHFVILGVLSGFLIIIPYIGIIISFSAVLVTSIVSIQSVEQVTDIAILYFLGNLFEGNLLTPKIVGDKIDLHPVWVMFGCIAGMYFFGLLGIVLAFPLTAAFGVLVRFFVYKYKNSKFYLGV